MALQVLDEILFRYDQIEFWFYTRHWLAPFIHDYPVTFGLVIGVITGYYAEPFMDWCERMQGRRAMRRRLHKNRVKQK